MSRNGRAKVLSPSFLAAFLSGVHRRAPRKVSTMAAVQTSDVTTYQMYIGGRWVDASNRETSEILDPSSENVIARVPRATVADAETAVKAARAAFDTGPWPRMKAVERGEILRRAATRIRERAGELARLESLQMGKLFSEAIVGMSDAAYTFDYYAGLVVEAHGETLEVPGETMSMVVREPVGVTVGITPWNYPMLMAAWKAAPSLAAGNVMILKPATVSPLTNLELAKIFEEVGLPEGVFQVITGPGGEIGDYLAAQLQADLLHVLGAPAHDVLANLAGAGERDHVDERRGGKIVADLAAGPGDH